MKSRRDHRSWSEWSYDQLLRAYPRDHRRRFGAAMRDTFRHDRARVRAAGRAQ